MMHALIAHMKLQIEKLKRDKFGPRSERASRLLDQMAFELEELEGAATEDELAAERAAAKTTNVAPFTRNRPARKPFPEHLPRERVVVAGPTACTCCGGARLAKLGETITETLETIPRTWKVIQHVREKFTCRDCEKISQAPAPFHVIPRGWAGPSFLAMLVFEKFGQHQPLNRQAERYAREGVPLSLSTLADQVGACCVVLDPIVDLLIAHVFAGARVHGDDTTVPVLAKGQTDIARSWVYVRDDRPFGGLAPPAAVFYYSRDRRGEHPQRTWRNTQVFCRLMPLAVTTNSTNQTERRGRFRGGVLGAFPTKILRTRRSGENCQTQSARWQARFCLANGAGSGAPDRRAVRYRARDQRQVRRRAPRRAADIERAAGRGTGGLDDFCPSPALTHDDAGKAMNYMLKRWPRLPGSWTTAGSA